MPNYVYNTIKPTTDKAQVKLDEILSKSSTDEKGRQNGIEKYYKPMPKELKGTRCPVKEPNQELIDKHGADNWYDWCLENWNTKWGSFEVERLPSSLNYETARAPLSNELISKLAEDIGDFDYEWMEEQGYGAEVEFRNGECVKYWDYTIDFDTIDDEMENPEKIYTKII